MLLLALKVKDGAACMQLREGGKGKGMDFPPATRRNAALPSITVR